MPCSALRFFHNNLFLSFFLSFFFVFFFASNQVSCRVWDSVLHSWGNLFCCAHVRDASSTFFLGANFFLILHVPARRHLLHDCLSSSSFAWDGFVGLSTFFDFLTCKFICLAACLDQPCYGVCFCLTFAFDHSTCCVWHLLQLQCHKTLTFCHCIYCNPFSRLIFLACLNRTMHAKMMTLHSIITK